MNVIDWSLSILIVTALLRSRSGFLQSDQMVTKLIIISAESQLIPSLSSLIFLAKSLIIPTSLFTFLFAFEPKVWVATCLQVIIMRHTLRMEIEVERQRRQNTFDLGLTECVGGVGSTVNQMTVSVFRFGPAGWRMQTHMWIGSDVLSYRSESFTIPGCRSDSHVILCERVGRG